MIHLQQCLVGWTGSVHRWIVVNKGLLAAIQAGGAGTDTPDSRQVRMMEDGQLHGQTAPHAATDITQQIETHSSQINQQSAAKPGVWLTAQESWCCLTCTREHGESQVHLLETRGSDITASSVITDNRSYQQTREIAFRYHGVWSAESSQEGHGVVRWWFEFLPQAAEQQKSHCFYFLSKLFAHSPFYESAAPTV